MSKMHRCVWTLTSQVMLKGDCKDDAARIGGRTAVYESKDAALDDLREFMRPLVNDSQPEYEWEDREEHGCGVDDILDRIFDEGSDCNWSYDGTLTSFRVKLDEQPINREKGPAETKRYLVKWRERYRCFLYVDAANEQEAMEAVYDHGLRTGPDVKRTLDDYDAWSADEVAEAKVR